MLPRVGTRRDTPSDSQSLKTDFGKHIPGPTISLGVFFQINLHEEH